MTQRAPHDFWRFSLRVYRASGVQAACLALQDGCGADVNLLLLCGWLGAAGRGVDRRRLRHAMRRVGDWQSQVIAPVRGARRAIKRDPPPGADAAQALQRQILALELELEYVEQAMLFDLAAQWPLPARRIAPADAVSANLARYLALVAREPTPADAAHAETIAAACCAATTAAN